MLKAADRAKQPPSGWFGGDGTWGPLDRVLVLALQKYEDSLCRCGYPWWMGHAEEHQGAARREVGHCNICEQLAGSEFDHDQPGDKPYVSSDLIEMYVPKRLRPKS